MQKIKEWYFNGFLADCFAKVLTLNPDTENEFYFFNKIYLPFRFYNPDTGIFDEEWHYEQCGWDNTDVTMAYWSQYGANYFMDTYLSRAKFEDDLEHNRCLTEQLIEAVFRKNKYKYVKMIELAGYAYDPLNNVDAHEMHSEFEVHGDEQHNTGSSSTSVSQTSVKNTHSVAPYDSETASKIEYEDTVDVPTGTTAITPSATVLIDGTTVVDSEGSNVQKPNSVTSGAASGVTVTRHDTAKNGINDETYGTDYHVKAIDNAFGQELKGADYYKAVKDRRYGNIGTTKTTELLEAERENLRFNLLQEFFNDINEVILVGVF